MKDKVPKPEKIRSRFGFYTHQTMLSLGSKQFIDCNEDLGEYEDYLRESMEQRIEGVIEEAIGDTRDLLAETLTHLNDVINRDGRVDARSFAPVHRAMAKISDFKCLASAELIDKINNFEKRLNTTSAKDLNSVVAENNGFSAAIRALHAEVTDETKRAEDRAAFGRGPRNLRFS
jgi:hypothetical protein